MPTFDLHIHTSRYSPDSSIDPFELVERAAEIGLDGLVITEHDVIWPEEELEELRAAAPSLVILSGVEVSALEGHVLVYGITEEEVLWPGISWKELCREVHRLGGVAIAAHPNRFGQDFDEVMARGRPELDGIEVMSKNMDDHLRGRAQQLLRDHPHFAALGNSDAHEIWQLGMCITEFADELMDSSDLLHAIRQRGVTPRPGR